MKKNLSPQLIIGLIVVVVVTVASLALMSRRGGETDSAGGAACVDQCGNGSCQEMVCMAVGCPCAETKESCPQDCAAKR